MFCSDASRDVLLLKRNNVVVGLVCFFSRSCFRFLCLYFVLTVVGRCVGEALFGMRRFRQQGVLSDRFLGMLRPGHALGGRGLNRTMMDV